MRRAMKRQRGRGFDRSVDRRLVRQQLVLWTLNYLQQEDAMLVLTRKLGEKIKIGDDVEVSVERIEGGKVRLGIEAPESVPLRRAELAPPDASPRPAA